MRRALVAIATAGSLLACSHRRPPVGFWYETSALTIPASATSRLAEPLTGAEMRAIEQRSRAELEQAFAGFGLAVTADRHAFWRVEVRQAIQSRGGLPAAGQSIAMGAFGGAGEVDFSLVVFNAVQYAPPDASRQQIVDAIGRGVGRVAVHEFVHQMLGVVPEAHNGADQESYEFPSFDRAAQYYGKLHWSTARPLLDRKFRQPAP